uniref:EamA domain-containing protein n=1 Tax=Macrostomum lignano TaxID=282301 RepID=A0A1I8F900_9PLAT
HGRRRRQRSGGMPVHHAKYPEGAQLIATLAIVPIVPAMAELKFKATGWLGIITAGLLWMDFRRDEAFDNSIVSLTKEIIHAAGDKLKIGQASPSQPPALKVDLKKKPAELSGTASWRKFLAESGEVKHHQASGSRSTLAAARHARGHQLLEESKLEPNTSGQHYGAEEEWLLISDEESTDGRRAVVTLRLAETVR